MASMKRAGSETRLNKINEVSAFSSFSQQQNKDEPKATKTKGKRGRLFCIHEIGARVSGSHLGEVHAEGLLASAVPGAARWCPGWRGGVL